MRSTFTAFVLGVLAMSSYVPVPALLAGDGLLAHWTFDAVRDGVAADAAGAGHQAKVLGPTRTRGRLGDALAFDSRDDYVALGDLGRTDAATIACWMKAEDVHKTGDWQGLVTSDAWEEGVFRIGGRGGRIDVYWHLGQARRGALHSGPLKNGTWHHVAIIVDGGPISSASSLMECFATAARPAFMVGGVSVRVLVT